MDIRRPCRLRRLSGSQPAVRSYPVRELRKYQCDLCLAQTKRKSVNARATIDCSNVHSIAPSDSRESGAGRACFIFTLVPTP